MKKIKKIIEYGLYLIAFLLPIQTRLFLRLGETEYSTISLYGIDILIALILLLHIYIFFKRLSTFNSQLSITWWLIAGLDLFIFISIFFVEDKWLSVYHYGIFLLSVGLFWLLVSAEYKKIKLVWSFLLGLSLQAVLGIWQFFTQTTFASKWLGIAMHNSGELGVSVIDNGSRWLRAYGGFDHPNILGGVMVVGLFLLFTVCHSEPKVKNLVSRSERDPSLTLRMTRMIVYCSLFTALLLSFSRAAWLAFAISFFILLIIYLIQKNYLKIKILSKYIFISILITLVFYSIYPNLFKTRIYGGTRLENKSSQERIASIKESKEIIKDNIFFGTGIGNYTLALENKYPEKEIWYYQPVHNTYLLILSEIGIFGFLFFLFIFSYLFFLNLKNQNYINFTILFGIAILMLFDHWLWSLHFGFLFFWFVIGIVYNRKVTIN